MPDPASISLGRLARGRRIPLGRNRDLFENGPTKGTYRRTEQGLLEPFEAGLARIVAAALESAEENTLTLFDLSGVVDADPREIVAGLRNGIRVATPQPPDEEVRYRIRPARRKGNVDGPPRWSAGHRFVAVAWRTRRQREDVLRSGVATLWELEDRRRPSERLPIPLLMETGARLLGHLPGKLAGARRERIVEMPFLTYHALIVAPDQPGNSAKAAGRELLRYEQLGLLVRRKYPSEAEARELGIPPDPNGQGHPQVWESVAAAAQTLFPR